MSISITDPNPGAAFSQAGRDLWVAARLIARAIFLLLIGFALAILEQCQNLRWGFLQFKGWIGLQRHQISTHKSVLCNRMLLAAGWGFGLAQFPMLAMVARANGM